MFHSWQLLAFLVLLVKKRCCQMFVHSWQKVLAQHCLGFHAACCSSLSSYHWISPICYQVLLSPGVSWTENANTAIHSQTLYLVTIAHLYMQHKYPTSATSAAGCLSFSPLTMCWRCAMLFAVHKQMSRAHLYDRVLCEQHSSQVLLPPAFKEREHHYLTSTRCASEITW